MQSQYMHINYYNSMPFKIRNRGHYSFGNHPQFSRMTDFKGNRDLIHAERILSYLGPTTRYADMIILHNYRGISRSFKQFSMGDRLLENSFILEIKNLYNIPNTFKAPLKNLRHFKRSLAEILDRHYAMFAHNTHPLQLLYYEINNKRIRLDNDELYKSTMDNVNKRIKELIKEKQININIDEGESLTVEDYEECYLRAMEEYRATAQFKTKTLDEYGEINDSLEIRRTQPNDKS